MEVPHTPSVGFKLSCETHCNTSSVSCSPSVAFFTHFIEIQEYFSRPSLNITSGSVLIIIPPDTYHNWRFITECFQIPILLTYLWNQTLISLLLANLAKHSRLQFRAHNSKLTRIFLQSLIFLFWSLIYWRNHWLHSQS